jgi:hypothetical protein
MSIYCAVFVTPYRGLAVSSLRKKAWLGWTLAVGYAAAVTLIAASLWNWGAVEVRGQGEVVLFLTLAGVIWLVAAARIFPWFGLSGSDDAVERQNPAALFAVVGATLAVAMIYSGGSLGEGPSYWDNVFSAGLGSVGFFALWFVLEMSARVSCSITEERDPASGLRCGAFFLGAGAILARAVAGDWHSEADTVIDFVHDGWFAGALCALAIVFERAFRPSARQPFPDWKTCGLPPALLYLACALAWLMHLGRWEGMPK